MCRHAAYAGPPLRLERFLLDPPHSLLVQSYRPREQLTAIVNGDGFGVGWYLPDGRPGTYTNPMPIWSDANLAHLGRALSSGIWIGNVRSATRGLPVSPANTPPYCAGGLLFSHNGFVTDFARALRPVLRRSLREPFEVEVAGNTDSEYLFALLRQELDEAAGAVEAALGRLFERLGGWLEGVPALLNLLVADGRRVYATRHAIGHASPSLYLGRDERAFGGGWLVASEPLTEGPDWERVPDHHLVVLAADAPPALEPL